MDAHCRVVKVFLKLYVCCLGWCPYVHCLDALSLCDKGLYIVRSDECSRFMHRNIFNYCVYSAMLRKPDIIKVRPLTRKSECNIFCNTELSNFFYFFKTYKAVFFAGRCL